MLYKTLFHSFFILIFLLVSALSCEPLSDPPLEKEYSLVKQFNLPDDLSENSGMIFFDSLMWTINDGGDEPALYALNLSEGNIVKTIYLAQKENKDWEDITQDDNFIYVGDFGNNNGNRDDLVIYKIAKALITGEKEQVVYPIEIFFRYEDQTDFIEGYNETSFDCEAFIVKGDSLYLFTKDWVNNFSTIYRIPKYEGTFLAKKTGRISSNGLVTGADSNHEQVVLCGYNGWVPFVIIIQNGNGIGMDSSPKQHFQLYEQTGYQFEGIAFLNDKIYLTAERSATMPACWEFILK